MFGGVGRLFFRSTVLSDMFIRARTYLLRAVELVYGESMQLHESGSLNWLCFQ